MPHDDSTGSARRAATQLSARASPHAGTHLSTRRCAMLHTRCCPKSSRSSCTGRRRRTTSSYCMIRRGSARTRLYVRARPRARSAATTSSTSSRNTGSTPARVPRRLQRRWIISPWRVTRRSPSLRSRRQSCCTRRRSSARDARSFKSRSMHAARSSDGSASPCRGSGSLSAAARCSRALLSRWTGSPPAVGSPTFRRRSSPGRSDCSTPNTSTSRSAPARHSSRQSMAPAASRPPCRRAPRTQAATTR